MLVSTMGLSKVMLIGLIAVIARNWLYVDGGEVTFEGNGSAKAGIIALSTPKRSP